MKYNLEIEMPEGYVARLEELQKRAGLESTAETVRQALQVYEWLVERTLEGDMFTVQYADGRTGLIEFFTVIPTRKANQ